MKFWKILTAETTEDAFALYKKLGGAENLTATKIADLQALAAQATTYMLSTYLINLFVSWITGKATEAGTKYLVESYLEDHKIPRSIKGKYLTMEERLKVLGETKQNVFRFGLLRDIVTRVGSPSDQTNKITLNDVVTAIGIVPITVGGTLILVKPVFARLIGAQTFSHGTSTEGAKKILGKGSRGLDSNFGATRTGATRIIAKSPVKNYHLLSRGMKDPLATLGGQYGYAASAMTGATIRNVEKIVTDPIHINTDEFVNNAIQRTYVAKDGLGRIGASKYALTHITPSETVDLLETFFGDGLKAVENKFGFDFQDIKKSVEGLSWDQVKTKHSGLIAGLLQEGKVQVAEGKKPASLLKAVYYGAKSVVTSPFSFINTYRKFYSTNPEKTHVIAGVMPFEDFHAKMEVDPDDITYGGTGYRSRRAEMVTPDELKGEPLRKLLKADNHDKIDQLIADMTRGKQGEVIGQEHLRAGSNTFKQIWKNRTRDYKAYLSSPLGRGRLLGAAGMLGAGAGLSYLTWQAAKPVVLKAMNKHEIKRKGDK